MSRYWDRVDARLRKRREERMASGKDERDDELRRILLGVSRKGMRKVVGNLDPQLLDWLEKGKKKMGRPPKNLEEATAKRTERVQRMSEDRFKVLQGLLEQAEKDRGFGRSGLPLIERVIVRNEEHGHVISNAQIGAIFGVTSQHVNYLKRTLKYRGLIKSEFRDARQGSKELLKRVFGGDEQLGEEVTKMVKKVQAAQMEEEAAGVEPETVPLPKVVGEGEASSEAEAEVRRLLRESGRPEPKGLMTTEQVMEELSDLVRSGADQVKVQAGRALEDLRRQQGSQVGAPVEMDREQAIDELSTFMGAFGPEVAREAWRRVYGSEVSESEPGAEPEGRDTEPGLGGEPGAGDEAAAGAVVSGGDAAGAGEAVESDAGGAEGAAGERSE